MIDITGKLNDHANYDVSYTEGKTDVVLTKLNNRLNTRFREALDAVRDPVSGQIVCRSATARAAGCLPVNTFGANTINPASFDYFIANPQSFATLDQHVVNASLNGDFGQMFSLPGGPVAFAFGGEYRRESSSFRPSQDVVNNIFYQFDDYIIPTRSTGKFDVWEAFGEINVPLLKDAPMAELLSFGAAGRLSDYSTIGSTHAYQFNGIYSPIRAISFRGSYGRSVRAPNIGELFRPPTGTSAFLNDPCYINNRSSGTQFRNANCLVLIQARGGNPATFTAANNSDAAINIPGVQRGNLNLRAEVSRTWTAGIVLRPDFIPGLQIGVDWYDIRLEDAINTPSATTVANLCVDQPTIDNAFCAAIDRRQGTGYISGYRVQPQNVAVFRTAGLEVNANYSIALGATDTLDLRLVGGYLDRLDQLATPGAVVENNRDRPFRPMFSANFSPTYTTGPVTLSYNLRWQNGVRRFARINTDTNPTYVDPQYFRFKQLWQHDVYVEFRAGDRFSFYGGVNNVADRSRTSALKRTYRSRRWVAISSRGRVSVSATDRSLMRKHAPAVAGACFKFRSGFGRVLA